MVRLSTLLAAALWLPLASTGSAADPEAVGRLIYEEGRGRSESAITATIGETPVPIAAAARACARCHGSTGLGASEGGVSAPPLAPTVVADGNEDLVHKLGAALREGRGTAGRMLLPVMPRYSIADADLAALARYVQTLPYPTQPGLEAGKVRIGINLTGSGFDHSERALLRERIGDVIDRLNAEGGFFGRTVVVADEDVDSFFTLSWAPDPGRPNLAIVSARPDEAPCEKCCGSLQAGLREQVDWLAQWLEARALPAAFQGSLASAVPSAQTTEAPQVTVHIGAPGEIANPPTGPLYLFAGMGAPQASIADLGDTYLVTSVDMDRQVAATRALQRDDPRFGRSPRLASAAVEFDRALLLLGNGLTRIGRRVSVRSMCEEVGRAAAAEHRFSILDLRSGLVVASSDGATEKGSSGSLQPGR